jgi:hypothetical protein
MRVNSSNDRKNKHETASRNAVADFAAAEPGLAEHFVARHVFATTAAAATSRAAHGSARCFVSILGKPLSRSVHIYCPYFAVTLSYHCSGIIQHDGIAQF